MSESVLKLAEVKLVLKSKGLNYKLKDRKVEDSNGNCLTFIDVHSGTQLRGKIVRTFNEGEVYHWPLLNHQNLAPLIEVLYIRGDLSILLTTDQQVTLKDIIHDGDFVYDRRCFDRKRSYAKGIFSGLSYLHGKSLCLMNLTDDNIAICKTYDKAVITDFSCLVSSGKTSSKMKVPEVYKAPESEKGEFDAIMAEMWSSGALMLDLFLAHMVPWAVVDYKPKKVMGIVDKLNLELLQAANAGSVVTYLDLSKYKAFLKCFFRQNPLTRISARLASIASFLHPNLQDSTLRIEPVDKSVCLDTKLATRNVKKECFISNNLLNTPDLRDSAAQFPHSSRRESMVPIKYYDSKNFCEELTACCKQQDISNCKISNSGNPRKPYLYFPEVNGRRSPLTEPDTVASAIDSQQIKKKMSEEINNEIGASKGTTSVNIYVQEEENQFVKSPLSFFYESNDSFAASQINAGVESPSKSCQSIKNEKETFNETNYTCYQSKSSLSFIKSKLGDSVASIKFCSRKTFSYSSIKSVTKQVSASDLWNSHLCLDRLFEESDLTEGGIRETKDQNAFEITTARDVRGVTKSREDISCKRIVFASPNNSYRLPTPKLAWLSKNNINQSGLLNDPDVLEIWNKIQFLKTCKISLRDHSGLFISEEFNYKQRKVLSEYENLLHTEYLRLRKRIKEISQLKINQLLKLRSPVPKNFRNLQEALPQSRNKNISYKICQNKLLETEKHILKQDVISTKNHESKFADTPYITPKMQLKRRYSYYKAVEASSRYADRIWKYREASEKGEQEKSIFTKENNSEDKLIEPVKEFDRSTLKATTRKRKFENALPKPCETDKLKEPEAHHRIEESSQDLSKCRKKSRSKKDNMKKIKEEKKCNKEKKDKTERNSKKEKRDKKEKTRKSDKQEEDDKKEKNDKKLSDYKREGEMRNSFFFNLCPGGKVEEPTPILDNLCETCKLNLEMI